MKEHYCPADKTIIGYEGECNWCGEKENDMKEKALKLAEIEESLAIELPADWSRGEPKNIMTDISAMIRRLIEELDKLGKGDYMEGWEEGYQACKNDNQTQPKSLLVNVVGNHIEDLLKCVEIFNSHRMLGTAREMKEAIKELVDAINTIPQTKPLSDDEIIEIWGVESIWDDKLIAFARAILKKASEK